MNLMSDFSEFSVNVSVNTDTCLDKLINVDTYLEMILELVEPCKVKEALTYSRELRSEFMELVKVECRDE